MSMIESIRTVLRKYADFNGRARLSEYWWWTLARSVILLILLLLFVVIGAATMDPVTEELGTLALVPAIILMLFVFATFLPDLAVTARRLHDSDKSAWWLLLRLEPSGVGGIVLLVFTILSGTPSWNKHGPSPKYPDAPYPWPVQHGVGPYHPGVPPHGQAPQPYPNQPQRYPNAPYGQAPQPYQNQPYQTPQQPDQAPPQYPSQPYQAPPS